MSSVALAVSLLAVGGIWKFTHQKAAVASATVTAPNPSQQTSAPALSPQISVPELSRQTILRLAGSDPAATRLLSSLAESYLRKRGATDIHQIPSQTLEPTKVEGTFAKEHAIQAIEIAGTDSGHGPESVSAGWAEISLSPRRPKPSTAPMEEHAFVSDGLAVIVHPGNPIAGLSRNHLVTLLGGLVTDWSQLKQNAGEIRVYVPDEGAGGYETLRASFPGVKRLGVNAQKFTDPSQISDAIANDPNGIGFVTTDRMGNAKSVAIEDEEEAGRSFPTETDIVTGAYPLARRLYLYHLKNPDNPLVREFVSLSLSPVGQDLARHAGFIPLGGAGLPKMAEGESGGTISEYAHLTSNAMHLSFDIHFGPASTHLDAAALSQIRRAQAFLDGIGPDHYSLLLLGFSDSSGSPLSHLPVSRLRARRVAQEFSRHGTAATVIAGLGSYQPTAADDTPEENENGRRVEVWLKQK